MSNTEASILILDLARYDARLRKIAASTFHQKVLYFRAAGRPTNYMHRMLETKYGTSLAMMYHALVLPNMDYKPLLTVEFFLRSRPVGARD